MKSAPPPSSEEEAFALASQASEDSPGAPTLGGGFMAAYTAHSPPGEKEVGAVTLQTPPPM